MQESLAGPGKEFFHTLRVHIGCDGKKAGKHHATRIPFADLHGILPGGTAGLRLERCCCQENACADQCTRRCRELPDDNLSCVANCEIRKTFMHLWPPRIIQTASDDSAESNGQELLGSSGALIAMSNSMKKCKNPQTFSAVLKQPGRHSGSDEPRCGLESGGNGFHCRTS